MSATKTRNTTNQTSSTPLEELSYKDLQKIAKEFGIAANQKKDVLIKVISEMRAHEEVEEQESEVEEPAVESEPLEDQQQPQLEPQEEQEEETQAQPEDQEEAEDETIVSLEKAVADVSFCLGADEEEEREEEEYGDEEEEQEAEDENMDPLENRFGGKLFGLATPTGQKKLFNSPALTQSGQKIDEKYNVHWRYEDYEKEELDPSSLITPKKSNISSCGTPADCGEEQVQEGEDFMEEEFEEGEAPEDRLGSNKLLGLPTPNGKSIFFLTPKDKSCDQYNVHWRYEDYLENDSTAAGASAAALAGAEGSHLPYASPPPAVHSGRSMKAALTPRSVGKFKFVHDHP